MCAITVNLVVGFPALSAVPCLPTKDRISGVSEAVETEHSNAHELYIDNANSRVAYCRKARNWSNPLG